MRLPTFYEQNLIPNWGILSDNYKRIRDDSVKLTFHDTLMIL